MIDDCPISTCREMAAMFDGEAWAFRLAAGTVRDRATRASTPEVAVALHQAADYLAEKAAAHANYPRCIGHPVEVA